VRAVPFRAQLRRWGACRAPPLLSGTNRSGPDQGAGRGNPRYSPPWPCVPRKPRPTFTDPPSARAPQVNGAAGGIGQRGRQPFFWGTDPSKTARRRRVQNLARPLLPGGAGIGRVKTGPRSLFDADHRTRALPEKDLATPRRKDGFLQVLLEPGSGPRDPPPATPMVAGAIKTRQGGFAGPGPSSRRDTILGRPVPHPSGGGPRGLSQWWVRRGKGLVSRHNTSLQIPGDRVAVRGGGFPWRARPRWGDPSHLLRLKPWGYGNLVALGIDERG